MNGPEEIKERSPSLRRLFAELEGDTVKARSSVR